MMKVIHNPRCSKSRAMIQYLEEKKIPFETILYLETGLSKALIEEIVAKTGVPIQDLLRTGEEEYISHYKGKDLTSEEWIEALIAYPKLLERPIVIAEDRAIIGRPLENIEKLIG